MMHRLVRDARFTKGLLARKPFSALVQVTNRCNMKCSFCDFWPNAAPKKDELTAADYARVAGEMAELGCFLVSVEGGEPMVRPDLTDIVRAFAARHVPVLFTNGWYVTPSSARALWDAGLTHASVSIDFPDAPRHDRKRGLEGAFTRAWRAVEIFRQTAPRGARQVSVMTVLMAENHADVAEMLEQTRTLGVGHEMTLLSDAGFRRGKGTDRLPPPEAAAELERLFARHDHVRFFASYFETMKSFLAHGPMPACTAGLQSLNLDHVGNVAACIERIGEPVGNVKTASVRELMAHLEADHARIADCQDCWTACRGFQQALAGGGSVAAFRDLATRMRS